MIPFKIKAKGVKEITGQLPTDWTEVTWKMYNRLKLSDGSLLGILYSFTEVPPSQWLLMSQIEIEVRLFPYLQFATSFPEKYLCPEFLKIKDKFILIPRDLGKLSWAQKIAAQKIIVESKGSADVLPELLAIYIYALYRGKKLSANEDDSYFEEAKDFSKFIFDDCSIVDLLGVFVHLSNEIYRLLKRDSENLSCKPTSEQVRAGIDKMNKYGIMNILDPLSGGNVLNHDSLLAIEYNLIFHKLNYDNGKNKFQERYADIITKK